MCPLSSWARRDTSDFPSVNCLKLENSNSPKCLLPNHTPSFWVGLRLCTMLGLHAHTVHSHRLCAYCCMAPVDSLRSCVRPGSYGMLHLALLEQGLTYRGYGRSISTTQSTPKTRGGFARSSASYGTCIASPRAFAVSLNGQGNALGRWAR